MRNVEVAMVDGVSFRDPEAAPKKATTIQLLVQDKQYEVLDTACNLGKLKLSLRAPDVEGSSSGNEPMDSGESFLKWLKDTEATKDRTAAAGNAVNSLSLIKGMFESIKPQQQVEARKEMLILTPGSVSVYRWVNGRKMPMLMAPEDYYNGPEGSQAYGAGATDPIPTSTSFGTNQGFTAPQGVPPADVNAPIVQPTTPAGNESVPANPSTTEGANASQPNLIWDPQSGTWQTGGFKPVYPQSQ
jgi:hypothetical protein